MTSAILHQATMTADRLRQVLKYDAANQPYDWQATYPTLAALDEMKIERSATIFPDDCPNNGHDAYALGTIGMPIDTGLSIAQAASIGVPSALDDLIQRNNNPWFCLTPVHWQAGRDKVNLLILSDIKIQESRELLDVIAPWLAEWGWHIHVTAANQWFIRANQPFDYTAPSLHIAVSDQLEHFLPHGRDLKRWQTLLTEIQMAWFDHPVNQARQAANQLSINSVWLDNASNATIWQQEKIDAWQAVCAQIQDFTKPEIHAHLAELNTALMPVLLEIKRKKTATITLLGDLWQQDIVLKKTSLLNRIKHKVRSHQRPALQWLETPQFEFLGR